MTKSPFADFNAMKKALAVREEKMGALATERAAHEKAIKKIEKEKIAKLVNDFNAKLAEDKDIQSLTSTAEKIQAALNEIEKHEEEKKSLMRKIKKATNHESKLEEKIKKYAKYADTDFSIEVNAKTLAKALQPFDSELIITLAKKEIILCSFEGKEIFRTVQAKVKGKHRSFSVNPKILSNIAAKFGDTDLYILHKIDFEPDRLFAPEKTVIRIKELYNCHSEFELPILITKNLATLPESKDTEEFEIPAEALSTIGQVMFTAADENFVRKIHTGVNVKINNGRITATATNTHQLATADAEYITTGKKLNTEFNLPFESAKTLSKIINEVADEEKIKVSFKDNTVTFRSKSRVLTSKTLEGDFPPIDKILRAPALTTLNVLPEDIIPVLQRASVLATKNNHKAFSIESDGEKVIVKSSDEDNDNKYSEVLHAAFVDEGNHNRFKLYYKIEEVMKALKTLATESDDGILLEFTKDGNMRIKSEVNTGFVMVSTASRLPGIQFPKKIEEKAEVEGKAA